jgi:hypothetical protein
MKSALYISVIAALFLASCTERLPEPQVPDIQNDYTTVISASVNPLTIEGISAAGEFAWNESHTMGVSGSEMGKNELYVPVKSTIGTSEALFYGGAVKGEFAIYAPYTTDGAAAALLARVVVPTEQNYYADPLEYLMYNSCFYATTATETVNFDFHTGLLKIYLKHNLTNIKGLKVTVANLSETGCNEGVAGYLAVGESEQPLVNPQPTIHVGNYEAGLNSSEASPLAVYVAVAPGKYGNFVVEVETEAFTLAMPVRGPFVVNPLAITELTAKKVDHSFDVDDFESENGTFN